MKPVLVDIDDPLTLPDDGSLYYSRKLDGYFATYDVHNECFRSSSGNVFVTPNSHKLPPDMLRDYILCGELLHRDGFEATGCVRRTRGVPDWSGITFHPFDLIDRRADYQWIQRQRDLHSLCAEMRTWLVGHGKADILPIKNTPFVKLDVKDHMVACKQYNFEGLVFRNERSRMADREHGWKWKVKKDMDGILVRTEYGEGRCRNMPGATLVLEILNPITRRPTLLRVGGKTDEIRKNPPPIDSVVTFEYRLLSEGGIPQKPILKQVRY